MDNTSSTNSNSVTLSGFNEFKYNGSGLRVISKGQVTLYNISATNNSSGYGTNVNNASSTVFANVNLYGVNSFNENGTDGLRVQSAGAITLYKVTANFNGQADVTGYGIWLENTAAVTARSVALLAPTEFSDNFDGGLFVHSEGTITTAGLTAIGNGGNGIEIDNLGSTPIPQNVIISGSIAASFNGGSGLIVESLGAISVLNITVNDNSGSGAVLTNNGGTLAKPVTISGSNIFSGNDTNGLEVYSQGTITLNNVIAMNNFGYGGNLDNSHLTAIGGVYLYGISEFSGNTNGGLIVKTRGFIQITNVKANSNIGIGITLDNAEPSTQSNIILGTKLINWCNEFSQNTTTGAEISSNGTVTLNNICANGNGSIGSPGFGAIIDNTSSTNLAFVNLIGANTFNSNYLGGIRITSDGPIAINNLTSSNSIHGFGAILNNTTSGIGSPRPITLTGLNHFSANYGNGITINSYGAISGSNLNANGNGSNGGIGYGAVLDNCNFATSGCTAVAVVGITLSGKNTFNSNSIQGLLIKSLGSITLNNLETQANDGNGALLDNNFPGAKGNVTITSRGYFSENGGNGLEITSRGVIGLTNLEASHNSGYGANLSNVGAPYPLVVTLAGYAIFSDNGSYGLDISTLGNLTVYNLQALNNDSYGALLDNAEAGATGTIALWGNQKLQENGGTGLEIHSKRAITVNNLTSSLNDGFGALIENSLGGLPFDIKIAGINSLNNNELSGAEIFSLGNVFVNSLTSNLNGQASVIGDGYGAYVDNQTGATLAKTVSFTGVSSFNENLEDGLHVISLGAISGNTLTAHLNGGAGVSLDNEGGTTSARITLAGWNAFDANADFGLVAKSAGQIYLTNISANFNTAGGMVLDNSEVSSPVDVILSGFNFFNNNGSLVDGGNGLLIGTQGRITLSNVTARGNGSHGVWLNNKDYLLTPSSPTVTFTGTNMFSANGGIGLYVLSAGDVTVSKFTADGNIGDGLNIASRKNVYLYCGSITSNKGIGLVVSALNGKLTMNGVFAYGNLYANSVLNSLSRTVARGCS